MRHKTLTTSLMTWALGALLIVWAGFLIVGYRTGVHEADELTDGHLASVALLELAENPSTFGDTLKQGTPSELSNLKAHDYQRSMSMVVWDAAGKVLIRVGEAPEVPFSMDEGYRTLQLGSPPEAWRTFSRWDNASHTRRITVLLNALERDDLADDIAGQMASPGFWLLPVVALALGFAIHRGLRPLHALARDVDALNIHEPAPLQGHYHHLELRAVADSINTMAGRYQSAVSKERDLASELAHELRTPLASLTLQARALRQARTPAEHEALLVQLEQDALRAGDVLANLLSLARASRTELVEAQQAVDLNEIVRAEVAEFGQAALDGGHDLALVSEAPFVVMGHRVLLGLVVRNLVENALSHTPAGTTVEVALDAGARWLQVSDSAGADEASPVAATSGRSGPASGSRSLGLGSGHKVVEKIAAIHGAVFAKVQPPAGFRTCYRVTFGAYPPAGTANST